MLLVLRLTAMLLLLRSRWWWGKSAWTGHNSFKHYLRFYVSLIVIFIIMFIIFEVVLTKLTGG